MAYRAPTIINDRKIRFAVVGCGRISGRHTDALAEHTTHAELVAVCDTAPNVLEEASSRLGVPGYGSLETMLAATDVDVVALCTPSGLHPGQAVEVARAGRHVVTEKPMATRLADGKRMVGACDAEGVHLFVVKQNRLNPTLQCLKKALLAKRFGRIYMVNVNVFWTRPQDYYDSARWRGTWEFDGGALMNQASHYVDLLDWLVGPIESVHAYTATLERNIEVEDSAVANIKWRSGALGSINVTMLTYPRNLEGSITILGEKGSVVVGGVAVNEIKHWEFETTQPEDEAIMQANYQTASVYGVGHPTYYENVIKVLRGEGEPETDGREGLRSLETLIAMYTSARDGRRVSLPLEY
ncbi:MAG: Gfo/Idh/MocA family oxidoreductase [Gammaproteobacteria bacterium]|nr:Gfo/Idh/MocA family oxidoreductase [Gammaproteobacteria bacterium]MCP5200993.1 Gfo/Idh/MocA family oxidoreductase [Gammaproteobacteria bacterium]